MFVERESLERLLAEGLSLEAIARRFGKDRSTVGYWVKKHGLTAVNREIHASRGGLDRECVDDLIEQGASIPAMARELGVSESTVQYWLRKWGLQTRRGRHRSAAAAAKGDGRETALFTCRHHGTTEFWLEGRGNYRCVKCRGDAVARRRRKVKGTLVEEGGGSCVLCGYDRCLSALHFHHVDPATKSFSLGNLGHTRSLERMREEASKCVLLCANCHAEVEVGIVILPSGQGPGVVRPK